LDFGLPGDWGWKGDKIPVGQGLGKGFLILFPRGEGDYSSPGLVPKEALSPGENPGWGKNDGGKPPGEKRKLPRGEISRGFQCGRPFPLRLWIGKVPSGFPQRLRIIGREKGLLPGELPRVTGKKITPGSPRKFKTPGREALPFGPEEI